MDTERIPDFYVEQYLVEEAPGAIARRIESEPQLRVKAEALRQDSVQILETYPPSLFVGRIRNRAHEQGVVPTEERRGRMRSILSGKRVWYASAFAAVLAVAVMVPIFVTQFGAEPSGSFGDVPGPATGVERVKGLSPKISIYRQQPGGRSEELADGETAVAGDRLQVAYRAAEARHGVILSVDGRGVVTLHYPRTVFDDTDLVRSGEVALPYAYVLDDSPQYERFFFLVSEDPVDVQRVISEAERLAASDPDRVLPSTFEELVTEVTTFTVLKVEETQ